MANYGEYITAPGLTATGDQSGNQYKPVKAGSTSGTVKVATAATDKVIGILQNKPTDGKAAEVAVGGVSLAYVESGVAMGDKLTASSSGRLKTTTTTDNRVAGIALRNANAAGDLIPVLVSIGHV